MHIKKSDAKRLETDSSIALSEENKTESYEEQDESKLAITPEDEEKFISLSQRADLYDLLAHSVAPSIFGLDDVKKGALLQLFGGAHKVGRVDMSGAPKIRYIQQIEVFFC